MTEIGTTADRILDVTQELIQTRGYSAISFSDIAVDVGIKKPSIIHHFPTKAALTTAVVKRYREHFWSALEKITTDPHKTTKDAFHFYCAPYTDFGATKDKICLCGALAGEFTALPKSVQKEVSRFFGEHLDWLENILQLGQKRKEFSFNGPARPLAQLILDSLQGALLVKRATNDTGYVLKTIEVLKSQLTP